MKKTAVFLVVLSLVAGVGFYGASWFGSYQMLQRIKSRVAAIGVLDWEGIEPAISGRVRIEQLRLTVFELNQPVLIDAATFDAGSPQNLLRWLFDPKSGWPAGAQLSLRRVQLLLRPDLSKSWVTTVTDEKQWPRPWHLRACGEHRVLNSAALIHMGVSTVNLDLQLRWGRSAAGTATLNGEINAGELGSVDFNMASADLPRALAEWDKGLPRHWQTAQLVLRDGGFMRRLAAICSQDRHPSPSAWAQAETGQLQQELAGWGLVPGAQLIALYQKWLGEGGAVALELPATAAAGLVDLPALTDYLQRDDLAVLYNDQRIADFSLSLDLAAFTAQMAPPPTPVTVVAVDNPTWRATPTATLAQWRERRVRVTLATGNSLEGRLSAINERQFEVTRSLEGGEFAVLAKRPEIAALEVWRRRTEAPVIPPVLTAPPQQAEPQAAAEPIF